MASKPGLSRRPGVTSGPTLPAHARTPIKTKRSRKRSNTDSVPQNARERNVYHFLKIPPFRLHRHVFPVLRFRRPGLLRHLLLRVKLLRTETTETNWDAPVKSLGNLTSAVQGVTGLREPLVSRQNNIILRTRVYKILCY